MYDYYTVFMLVGRKQKKITILNFARFSDKGRHTLHYDTLWKILEHEIFLC